MSSIKEAHSTTPNNEEEMINEEPYYQPDFFGEHDKYLNLVETLLKTDPTDVRTLNTLTNQVIQLLEPFQAYSQLLDTYLHSLTTSIFQRLEQDIKQSLEERLSLEQNQKILNLQYYLSKIIYTLMKVRGWKVIIKLMPNSVHLIEPLVFNLITYHPCIPTQEWEAKYVLMIWLSFLLLNPFDLTKIDSGNLIEGKQDESLAKLIYAYGSDSFKLNGKPSESGTILVSRLLIRKDTFTSLFPDFFESCKSFIPQNFKKNFGIEVQKSTCLLKTLIYTLKFGNRLDFISYQPELFDLIDVNNPLSITYDSDKLSSLNRRWIIKLIQRISLVVLKPVNFNRKRIRGLRTLGSGSDSQAVNSTNNVEIEADTGEDDELDIPPELEALLGTLLEKLSDPETIVRWSTSKALGRITQRLPNYMHMEIAEAILEAMEEPTVESPENPMQRDWSSVDDTTWHGACLSLAELARRGLLSADLLSKTIDKIILALQFEQKRGSRVIGSNVRDAACFCLWSFARAYSPQNFEPFKDKISTSLIVRALFDRELQVRRASSAAFQELVGRLGIFDHGIKLVGLVDYFSVGNINRSYLKVALEVAQLPEYQDSLVDYLTQVGSIHWDNEIRALSSALLNKVVQLNPNQILEFSLPKLVSYIKPPRLPWIYHGALLNSSSLLNGWIKAKLGGDYQLTDKLTPNLNFTFEEITKIVTNLPPADFTDFGTHLILEGACQFIENLSACQWPTPPSQSLLWLQIIHLGLERSEERNRNSALKALNKLTLAYPLTQDLLKLFQDKLNLVINGNLDGYLEAFLLSFGEIKFWEGSLLTELPVIIKNLELITKGENFIIEFRRGAFVSLNKLFLQLIESENFELIEQWDSYPAILIECLNDYSIDSRGDVGSWLRQEAFIGSKYVINYFKSTQNPSEHYKSYIGPLVGNILQQSVEKIDRIRHLAGELLFEFVNSMLEFEGKQDIQKFFNENEEIEWTSPKQLFPLVMPLLRSKSLMPFMLQGLVASTETNMENLSLCAIEAFIAILFEMELESEDEAEVTRLEVVSLLVKFIKDKGRLVGPSLQTLHPILESGALNDESPNVNKFFSSLLDEVFEILKTCTDYTKLQQLSNICGDLTFEVLEFSNLCKKVWRINLRLLTHRFPKIRVYTSERLFNSYQVSVAPDELEEFHEKIGALLLDQDFQLPLAKLLDNLKFIYEQFGLPMPTLKSKPK